MVISRTPSWVAIPADIDNSSTVIDFLISKFPHISADIWLNRINDGKVSWETGELVTLTSTCQPQCKLRYYREVEAEAEIPFYETILYEDENIIIADKPHFLPVVPGGRYVEQCLVHRLKKSTDNEFLQSAHRIDRDTAGLVLFVKQKRHRALYQQLFASRAISKLYRAVAKLGHDVDQSVIGQQWSIRNRMVSSKDKAFWMEIVQGEVNSHTEACCVGVSGDIAMFELKPVTGKRHQLRVHMASLGYGLLNDIFYPKLQDETELDYERPLQLLAYQLSFVDPVTGKSHQFKSEQTLVHWVAEG